MNLVLLGIQHRGLDIAKRIRELLEAKFGNKLPMGILDINLYRSIGALSQ